MALDFIAQYGTHFLLHRVKWMWRLHMVHHNDTHVDATTAFRHHPFDAMSRSVGSLVAVLMFGIPVAYYIFYRLLTLFFAYVTHANFRLPVKLDKAISYLLVTPDMHKFHQHFERPWTDTNFGNIFSFWDRMFGTLTYENVLDVQYGLDVVEAGRDENILYQYILPFDMSIKTDERTGFFCKSLEEYVEIQMLLNCNHCQESWELPVKFSNAVIELFRDSREGISSTAVKELRGHLGINMMSAKLLLQHVSSENGNCFSCQAASASNQRVISACGKCGTINFFPEGVT